MSKTKQVINVTVQKCCGSCKHFATYCEKCCQKLLTTRCNKINDIVVESQLCKFYDAREDMEGIIMAVEVDRENEQAPD